MRLAASSYRVFEFASVGLVMDDVLRKNAVTVKDDQLLLIRRAVGVEALERVSMVARR